MASTVEALLNTVAFLHSGHNCWSTIKHDKGKNDTARSKERLVISKDIIQASERRIFLVLILCPRLRVSSVWTRPEDKSPASRSRFQTPKGLACSNPLLSLQ